MSDSQLAALTDVTLVSGDAAHNSLPKSSFRDLADLTEDAAHNSLQMSSYRDLTDVTLVSENAYSECIGLDGNFCLGRS